jgi:hypothetical protein
LLSVVVVAFVLPIVQNSGQVQVPAWVWAAAPALIAVAALITAMRDNFKDDFKQLLAYHDELRKQAGKNRRLPQRLAASADTITQLEKLRGRIAAVEEQLGMARKRFGAKAR